MSIQKDTSTIHEIAISAGGVGSQDAAEKAIAAGTRNIVYTSSKIVYTSQPRRKFE
jgi:hypothetical protein